MSVVDVGLTVHAPASSEIQTAAAGSDRFVLTVTSRGALGLVGAIGGFLAERYCDITEMSQYDDLDADRYFSRVVFRARGEQPQTLQSLREAFERIARKFEMQCSIQTQAYRPRVLIMVSKADHCLEDLLYRVRTGDLRMDVSAIVSNHDALRPAAERHGIPFYVLPVTPETKAAKEAELLKIVEETASELVVLARYMQVLSNDLCEKLAGRAINIHHSLLPSFKGAMPYRQAHDRGVKYIGATAHYVTPDLDEGPIIEQAVERVDHVYSANELAAVGRDLECLALAKAVRYHIERKVFLSGTRTIVFR
ncbi:formyltetrahydrofolate deformylase [Caballeronia arvi]|uniref:Formyltetrahydrofolate deformylase n=1 Tax=Caballeronia arvi TaxID=1777135 RepID=A0A158KIY8_9BURK|nr:formyltetrahydrofolate deformylase [Caballeronia arvi]SAL80713.1 formyltetrahydrofolate deformylase [Caballeronia arvi]